MPNVDVYLDSRLDAEQIREFGFARVFLATGARWRRDGVGRQHHAPIPGSGRGHVVTPEAVMAGADLAGADLAGPVVIFDDDHFYLGGLLAEKLRAGGLEVALATPAGEVSSWTQNTLEQPRIQARLLEMGVEILAHRNLVRIGDGEVELACVFTGRRQTRAAASVVMVTARLPEEDIYEALIGAPDNLAAAGIKSVARIGDCLVPSTIAAAVHSGHRAARELDEVIPEGTPFRRELPALSRGWEASR
jgi:dimethylamine/trimethylamine dehydrogenase